MIMTKLYLIKFILIGIVIRKQMISYSFKGRQTKFSNFHKNRKASNLSPHLIFYLFSSNNYNKQYHAGSIYHIMNFGSRKLQRIWLVTIDLPKFYLSIFCFTLTSFCINTQSVNVSSTKVFVCIYTTNKSTLATAHSIMYKVQI